MRKRNASLYLAKYKTVRATQRTEEREYAGPNALKSTGRAETGADPELSAAALCLPNHFFLKFPKNKLKKHIHLLVLFFPPRRPVFPVGPFQRRLLRRL